MVFANVPPNLLSNKKMCFQMCLSVSIEAATNLPLSLLRNDSIARSCSRAFWVFLLIVRWLVLLVVLVGVPMIVKGVLSCSSVFL